MFRVSRSAAPDRSLTRSVTFREDNRVRLDDEAEAGRALAKEVDTESVVRGRRTTGSVVPAGREDTSSLADRAQSVGGEARCQSSLRHDRPWASPTPQNP